MADLGSVPINRGAGAPERVGGMVLKSVSRRFVLGLALSLGLLPAAASFAADKPDAITLDWATYNPVSMLLKDKGWLEEEFAKDEISINWVQSLGSNKALEFLNAGSIDFGSSAGAAALVSKINGNPIKSVYVFSKPEWTALVTTKDSGINSVADLKGKSIAVTRGTDPHIFLVRALQSAGLTEQDITPVLLQHPDGATALIRGDVDAWAGLDPMMANVELNDGARLFYRNADANTYGILSTRQEFLEQYPDLVKRVLAVYEKARKYALDNPDELKASFVAAAKLPDAVADKQLKERTDLSNGVIGAAQRDSILQAGLALQKAGVIDAGIDVQKTLDDLVVDGYVPVVN
jgi:sulfonate transport system substrate-binding protein